MIACALPFHILDLWPIVGLGPPLYCMAEMLYQKIMRRLFILPLIVLFTASGCAGAWKGAYVGATVTSKLIADTHQTWWVEPLDRKLTDCNPDTHPEITTTTQHDACLGVYKNNAEVLAALTAYNTAMKALEKILLATDDGEVDGAEKAQLAALWSDVTKAAIYLLTLFPEGEKHVSKLQALTR